MLCHQKQGLGFWDLVLLWRWAYIKVQGVWVFFLWVFGLGCRFTVRRAWFVHKKLRFRQALAKGFCMDCVADVVSSEAPKSFTMLVSFCRSCGSLVMVTYLRLTLKPGPKSQKPKAKTQNPKPKTLNPKP